MGERSGEAARTPDYTIAGWSGIRLRIDAPGNSFNGLKDPALPTGSLARQEYKDG